MSLGNQLNSSWTLAEKRLRSPATEYKLRLRIVVCNLRESGGLPGTQVDLLSPCVVKLTETDWVNQPWILGHYVITAEGHTHILNSYKSVSIHASRNNTVANFRRRLWPQSSWAIRFLPKYISESRAVSNTNGPLTLCRVDARSLLTLIQTHTHTHRRLWTQSGVQRSPL